MRYGPELLDPFDPDAVQPASIDLRLGTTFMVPNPHDLRYVDLGNMPDMSQYMEMIQRTPEQGFVLHPGEFALGSTAERISIPNNIVGRLEGKSSIGRIGLIIHVTAGFFDPGFDGVGTLEFFNVWRTPIILRPGEFICQMSFTYMVGPAAKPYAGKYKGDTTVAASRLGLRAGESIHTMSADEIDPELEDDDYEPRG